jgi:hypothetical protein
MRGGIVGVRMRERKKKRKSCGRKRKKSITIIDFGNLTNCYLHFAQSFSPPYVYMRESEGSKNSFIDIDIKIISNSP